MEEKSHHILKINTVLGSATCGFRHLSDVEAIAQPLGQTWEGSSTFYLLLLPDAQPLTHTPLQQGANCVAFL